MLVVDNKWLCEDGNTYTCHNSIFSSKESIWTFNCPCPRGGVGCLRDHICRFKPANAGVSLNRDSRIAKQLTIDYQELLRLITLRNNTIGTVGDEQASGYTNYIEFRELKERLCLRVTSKLCRFRTYCRDESCASVHSLEDLARPFDHPDIREFYRNKVIIQHTPYRPSTFILHELDAIRCPTANCSKGKSHIQLYLYDTSTMELCYPYYVIRCNECKRVTNLPVYQ